MKNKTILISQIFFTFICFLFFQNSWAESYDVTSPDGRIQVRINVAEQVTYEISHNGTALMLPSAISMSFDNGITAGVNGTIKNVARKSVAETINVPIGKNVVLEDHYNELAIYFNENYAITFRAYDDGIAYRFQTTFEEENIIVTNETADFTLAGNPTVYFPEVSNDKMDHWEKSYVLYNSISDIASKKFAVTPVLFSYPESSCKVALLEAGLLDYPALYIQQKGSNSVQGLWSQYPDQVEEPDNYYSNHYPITRFNYLARTTGNRSYPWRVVIVSNDDKSLLDNEIVYKLAEPQKLTDISWIQPGKSTWEWGSKAILEGVDFPSGGGTVNLSLELYKYYVDFAARNNIEYLTLDAGWSESYIRQLCAYAKGKGVKIIVWTWASCPLEYTYSGGDWLQKMKNYGVSGAKIDFVNRSDQPATNWLEQLAKRAAELEMVVMFHGCPVPTGLNRTYPNILNFEAVRGLENNYWDYTANPDYNMQITFIRMLAGPFDYTPGSMQNTTKGQFRPIDSGSTVPGTDPLAMGTRCHHLAMYILFDQFLGYMVDSPTEYEKYPDIMAYFQKVPTVWKKTIPLDAKTGEYAIIAKQAKNDDWFVGGMTNWTRRNINVDFSFLPEGIYYEATIYRDSTTSSGYPKRYVYEKKIVTKEMQMPIFMADGGGFAIILTPLIDSGIKEIKKESQTVAYISTDRLLTIDSKKMIQSIKIHNITGQLIKNESFTNSNKSEKINISDLSKGVYILENRVGTQIDVLKFIN